MATQQTKDLADDPILRRIKMKQDQELKAKQDKDAQTPKQPDEDLSVEIAVPMG